MSACTSPRQTSVAIHRRVVPGCFWGSAAVACAPPRHARSSASSAIDRTGARCLSVEPRPGASAFHLTCFPCTTQCCDVAWVPCLSEVLLAPRGGKGEVGVDDSVHHCVCFHLAQTHQVRLSRKEASVVLCRYSAHGKSGWAGGGACSSNSGPSSSWSRGPIFLVYFCPRAHAVPLSWTVPST